MELAVAIKQAKGWKNKIKIAFGKPGLVDPDIRVGLEKTFKITHNQESAGNSLNKYVVFELLQAL